MGDLVEIGRQRPFSMADADYIIPIVLRITKHHKRQVDEIVYRMEGLSSLSKSTRMRAENLIDRAFSNWRKKMQRLGAKPRGYWMADFDAGDGYFCWRYPEPEILYWHKYTDGFSKRKCVKRAIAPAVWVVSQSVESAVKAFR